MARSNRQPPLRPFCWRMHVCVSRPPTWTWLLLPKILFTLIIVWYYLLPVVSAAFWCDATMCSVVVPLVRPALQQLLSRHALCVLPRLPASCLLAGRSTQARAISGNSSLANFILSLHVRIHHSVCQLESSDDCEEVYCEIFRLFIALLSDWKVSGLVCSESQLEAFDRCLEVNFWGCMVDYNSIDWLIFLFIFHSARG